MAMAAVLSRATISLRLKPLTTTLHHFSSVSSAVSMGDLVKTSKTDKIGEFKKRLRIADIKGGESEGLDNVGKVLTLRGWVRTLRVQSSVTFIEVNDGSCLSNMQCVIDSDAEGYDQVEGGLITTGASICVQGVVVASPGKKQKIELKTQKLVTVGRSESSCPIQKKVASNEFLRSKAHLRPRTNTFGAVARVRNALAYATHKFFQENGFVWVASPIITATDCEGAGEQFCVTTLDFFGKPAFLMVSGQVSGETYATIISDVLLPYMIEPELAFADLNDDMACAVAYLQYVGVVEKSFVRMTYTDAVELLSKSKKKFKFPVKWGCDLQSEHERYITEEAFNGCPNIKAFYMRLNGDGKTVAAMDMLVPRVGELIGGSQREERLDYLDNRLDELKHSKDSLWWYRDLRRYGTVPHAGFGLGFERLVQFVTGIENIRDTIPFPRAPRGTDQNYYNLLRHFLKFLIATSTSANPDVQKDRFVVFSPVITGTKR
ncbi:asparagine--tRNA ligase, chloroplastic/mitochondrial [Tanacetum coccineum]